LENKRKTTTKFPRSVLKRNNRVGEGGASRLRVQKKQKKHKSMGLKDDNGENDTICSANICIGR
jgi:hypothetical protein